MCHSIDPRVWLEWVRKISFSAIFSKAESKLQRWKLQVGAKVMDDLSKAFQKQPPEVFYKKSCS